MTTATARYMLDNDGDGHWYLMPVEAAQSFQEFVDSDGETDQPDGVISLGSHPNTVTFAAPEHFGEAVG